MDKFEMYLPKPIIEALDRLDIAGHKGWLVGGCVRDAVMGVEPHDYDITTSSTPEQTIEAFAGYRVIETGLKHGTVTVIIDGEQVEITTFRVEGEYLDNRHPSSVSFTRRIEDDLQRRDFTINAMAYRPDYGLLDLYGGRRDIERRVIACVGEPEQRFNEDGLRIMRALRFASRLGFFLEEKTADAAFALARLLEGISVERLFSELKGILCGAGAGKVILEYSDILSVVIPELKDIIGFEQNNRYHCYDVLEHTCVALDNSPADPIVRLALLLHDIGKPRVRFFGADGYDHYHGHEIAGAEMADRIMLRLRADTYTRNTVVRLIELHDCTIIPDVKHAKRLLQKLTFDEADMLLSVKIADRMAHAEEHRDISSILRMREIIRELEQEKPCLAAADMAIGGRELMEIGVQPGVNMGRLINDLLEMIVNEEIENEKDALIEMARQIKDNYTEE